MADPPRRFLEGVFIGLGPLRRRPIHTKHIAQFEEMLLRRGTLATGHPAISR